MDNDKDYEMLIEKFNRYMLMSNIVSVSTRESYVSNLKTIFRKANSLTLTKEWILAAEVLRLVDRDRHGE